MLLSAAKSTRMSARFGEAIFQKGERVRAVYKKEFELKQETDVFYFPMMTIGGKLKPQESVLHDLCMRRLAASQFLSQDLVRYVTHATHPCDPPM